MSENQLAAQSQQPMGLMAADSQRAVQEVQAALVIAKQFPRNVKQCLENIIMSCTRPNLASQAVYQYARGGTDVTGPSVRLAECIAQNWTNIDFGFRELYRDIDDKGVGYSEVQAMAWDMETNTRRQVQFRVRHWRDTRNGGYALKDERDIYEAVASQAQRRVRACILAVVPGDITDDAVEQCEVTLAANADTSPEAVKVIVDQFAKSGVVKSQLEELIQRRMDAIQPGQVLRLHKILMSLRDGMSSVSEWFAPEKELVRSEAINPFPNEEEVATEIEKATQTVVKEPEGRQKKKRYETTAKLLSVAEKSHESGKQYFVVTMDNGQKTTDLLTYSQTIGANLRELEKGLMIDIVFTESKGILTLESYTLKEEGGLI